MRTLRLSLVGMVILALLAGPSVAVVGRSGDESGWATPVTGNRLSVTFDDSEEEYSEEAGYVQVRGLIVDETWEWSDPRLPSGMLSSVDRRGPDRDLRLRGTCCMRDPSGSSSRTAPDSSERVLPSLTTTSPRRSSTSSRDAWATSLPASIDSNTSAASSQPSVSLVTRTGPRRCSSSHSRSQSSPRSATAHRCGAPASAIGTGYTRSLPETP